MKIDGVDTLQLRPDVHIPDSVEVPYDTIYIGQRVLYNWNAYAMGFIPYCIECKEPLQWYSPPEGELLFECPKCGRRWIKDNDWLMDEDARDRKTGVKR